MALPMDLPRLLQPPSSPAFFCGSMMPPPPDPPVSKFRCATMLAPLWFGAALYCIQPICDRFERGLQAGYVGYGVAVPGIALVLPRRLHRRDGRLAAVVQAVGAGNGVALPVLPLPPRSRDAGDKLRATAHAHLINLQRHARRVGPARGVEVVAVVAVVGIRLRIKLVLKTRDFGDLQRWDLIGRCRAAYVAEFEVAGFEVVNGLVGGLQPVFDMLDMVSPRKGF